MKRWHEETKVAYRNWQNHLNTHRKDNLNAGKSPEDIACICEYQIGRFRKSDAYDCGHVECFTCHPDKLLREKSHQERIADFNFREQIREYSH